MRGLVQEVNEYYDFIIIPGFHTPDWAKGAVMYQIYPIVSAMAILPMMC